MTFGGLLLSGVGHREFYIKGIGENIVIHIQHESSKKKMAHAAPCRHMADVHYPAFTVLETRQHDAKQSHKYETGYRGLSSPCRMHPWVVCMGTNSEHAQGHHIAPILAGD